MASLVGQAVLCGFVIGMIKGSVSEADVGYHVSYLPCTATGSPSPFSQYLVAVSMWYTATINLPKLAILVVYRRLFRQRPMTIMVWIIGVALVLHSFVVIILLFVACIPFSANWATPDVQAEQCFERRGLSVWFSSTSIVNDFVMLVL
ncbi:hypothetical protein S40288_07574 [Stachybotrys chartarum IBT 40288]|nr:hypothetical protein S40288_07574 [Stachybotrys chartarum IBT 40288]